MIPIYLEGFEKHLLLIAEVYLSSKGIDLLRLAHADVHRHFLIGEITSSGYEVLPGQVKTKDDLGVDAVINDSGAVLRFLNQ